MTSILKYKWFLTFCSTERQRRPLNSIFQPTLFQTRWHLQFRHGFYGVQCSLKVFTLVCETNLSTSIKHNTLSHIWTLPTLANSLKYELSQLKFFQVSQYFVHYLSCITTITIQLYYCITLQQNWLQFQTSFLDQEAILGNLRKHQNNQVVLI